MANRRAKVVFAAMTGAQIVARARQGLALFDDIVRYHGEGGLFQV